MSGRPADSFNTKSGGFRAEIWAEIMELKQFHLKDLLKAVPADRKTISDYLLCLKNGGYLKYESDNKNYHLIKPYRFAPRLRKNGSEVTIGRGNEQMWRTMAMLKNFDADELAINASTNDCIIKLNSCKSYIASLFQAKYLCMITPAKAGHNRARYKLLKSKITGPKPPMIMRSKFVFDPNIGKVIWREGNGS